MPDTQERTPNPARGESALILHGETFIVRFSFKAMKELKEIFGKSLIKKFQEDSGKKDINLEDIMTVMRIGLKHGGNKIDEEDLEDKLCMADLADYIDLMRIAMGSKKVMAKKAADEAEAKASAEETDDEDPTTGTS